MSRAAGEPRDELVRARQRFSSAVGEATSEVQRHTGLRLGAAWVLPLVAAAAGVSAAWALRRKRRSRPKKLAGSK